MSVILRNTKTGRMKPIFVSLIICILCSSILFTQNTMANGHSTLEISFELSNETKRGTIANKSGGTFIIQSDDGNSYNAPAQEGYEVGDRVLHSDPVGHVVLILGEASSTLNSMRAVHSTPVKWKQELPVFLDEAVFCF